MSSSDVGLQLADECGTVGRAGAGNLDGDAVGSWNAVAVTRAGGVQPALVAEIGSKGGNLRDRRSCCCCCWWRRRRRRRGSITTSLNGLLLGKESGRHGRATLTRTIQILEGDQDGLNTCNLLSGAIPSREAERRDVGVVDDMPSIEVSIQRRDDLPTIRRARAWNFDRLAIRAIDGTITVTGASGVATLGKPSVGYEVGISIALDGERRSS
jgi:hypothetical protein